MNGTLMNRRSLLAASMLAAGAGEARAQPAGGAPSEVDVVVIGAGAAGIAAARKIAAAGRSVVVLEAKDRPGGRCMTDTVTFGVPMDLGAHWIHAPDDNPLVPLARAAGFALYDDRERQRLVIKGPQSPRGRVGGLRLGAHPRAARDPGGGRGGPRGSRCPRPCRTTCATGGQPSIS
jgi:choline dehydrogenase-like flavoprotein